jgi:ADP-ribose pyrophosphatase
MTTDEGGAVVLEHREAWHGRIFHIDADRVRLPNGHEVVMEVVRHRGSAVLLPMPDPGHLILVRQYRYAIGRWIWELAAGSLEEGESAEAGAIRECEEEIGLVPARAEAIGVFYPTPGFCDETMTFFRLTGLEPPAPGSPVHRDVDEDLRVATFALDEVRAMIRRGEIVDGKTVIGLSLVGG